MVCPPYRDSTVFLTDKVLAEFDERLSEGMVLTDLQKALML